MIGKNEGECDSGDPVDGINRFLGADMAMALDEVSEKHDFTVGRETVIMGEPGSLRLYSIDDFYGLMINCDCKENYVC